MNLHNRSIAMALLVFLTSALCLPVEAQDKDDGSPFKGLKYRLVGPFAGGRVSRACGVPGDPLIYYAATASGGVWKSSDGGLSWRPIFDDQPTSSIGAIAVAPSDPNVLYVGSGEANIRGNVQRGNGIYRSTDGGKTWKHVWKQEGQIGQIAIHARNADIAYAAVLGNAFGPNAERGVYRTLDGGKTWQQVLKKDIDTGAIEVCLDPSNPRIVFAALWQARRRPWEMTSGGPGSGIYQSSDGGDTWQLLGPTPAGDDGAPGKGLPPGPYGRIGLALAASNPQRVFALIEAEKGGLYRSDDGGGSWRLINPSRYLRIRPWYFSIIAVNPANADEIWHCSLRLLKSSDGGKSFRQMKGPHHVDHHDLWFDPKNPARIIESNDGGVDITTNGGDTWFAPPMPIAQFYHINVDNRVPYHVSGNMQDIGTASGPSNSLSTEGITTRHWHTVGGGETGYTMPDPTDPNIVYAGEYSGYISRDDHRTRQARNMSIYPINASGHGAGDLRYRFQWTAPILISPHDPKTIYHAANVLFKTTDQGKTWTKTSPDLTRDDKSKQQWSGGPITGDNTGAEYYCTIFAIAESPVKSGVLWAGTDDGLVHISRDAGGSWTNVTKNIPGLPEWGTVSCIEASRRDPGTAYVVVDAHRLPDNRPYLFKTEDYGKTWTNLTAGLPQDEYLLVVREDPRRPQTLYVGSERGVSYSSDGGKSWNRLKLNLPTVAVTDLRLKNNDLVIGTNGRSIWILDNLTPIRDLSVKPPGTPVLFRIEPATRWRYHSEIYGTDDKYAGANPLKGAIFDYFLPEKVQGEITLEITDAGGKTVTKVSSKKAADKDAKEDDPDAPSEPVKKIELPAKVGVNRVAWDLTYDGAQVIPGAKNDGGVPQRGPLVNPGQYTVKLTAGGKSYTQPLQVEMDPRVKISTSELAEQLKFALRVRDDIDRLSQAVIALRAIRAQLTLRAGLLKEDSKVEPFLKQANVLLRKVDALEARFHNPKAEVVYDILAQKGGAKLYSQMALLYEWLKDSDGPITQGMREVYEEQSKALRQAEGEVQDLIRDDLARLTEQARKLDLPLVTVPPVAAPDDK